MQNQPNFHVENNAVLEDLENLSSEQIAALVNGAGKILNKGRPGRLAPLKQAAAVKYTDLTKYLGGLND